LRAAYADDGSDGKRPPSAVRPSQTLTCKGRANYLKLKEIRKIAAWAVADARFDLKNRFDYLKVKILRDNARRAVSTPFKNVVAT
jgi:hypothetical protein